MVARNERLNKGGSPNSVSTSEEVEKAEAELAVADASLEVEARTPRRLAQAKLRLGRAGRSDEHIIRAPFSGPDPRGIQARGESVQANEAVVRLGNLDTVRVWAYIPLEYAYRVKPGHRDRDPAPAGIGPARSGEHPIEQKKFRGVVTSVDQSIQAVAETAVRIYADLDNPRPRAPAGPEGDHDLSSSSPRAAATPAIGQPSSRRRGERRLQAGRACPPLPR